MMMKTAETAFSTLQGILLNHGGNRVVEVFEEDLETLIQEGELFEGIGLAPPNKQISAMSRPRECHSNAANLYQWKPRRHVICTGWALSGDGLWRQHSWVLRKPYGSKILEEAIIETTTPRDLYYGIKLNKKQSERFVDNNLY